MSQSESDDPVSAYVIYEWSLRHKSFVHYDQKPETEKFSCDQCDKIFASKQRMKYHVEVKHLG